MSKTTAMNNTKRQTPLDAEARLCALEAWLRGSDVDAELVRALHGETNIASIARNALVIELLLETGERDLAHRLRLDNARRIDELDSAYRAVASVSVRHRRVFSGLPSGVAVTALPTVGSMLAWRCLRVVDIDLFVTE